MFAHLAILASALFMGAIASPITTQLDARWAPSVSFNHWGGFSSLDSFDNFYGTSDFIGSHFTQVVENDHEIVCHTVDVAVIQQRLAVIRELAKRVVTEQVCDVETQTVLFEQFHGGLGSFKDDLRHVSGHQVGYDSAIAGHFSDIFAADGSLTTDDFGFSGHDIGSHTVVVGGTNWDDATSFESVNSAYGAARHAFQLSNGFS